MIYIDGEGFYKMIVFNILLNIVMIFLFIVNKKYARSQKVINTYNNLIVMTILIISLSLARFSLLKYPNSTAGPILSIICGVMSLIVFFRVLKMIVYREY